MFKKDNVWTGIILGLVLPAIAFFITEVLKKNVRILQKDDLLYIGCVALNLILVKHFYKKMDSENIAKGVVASTFICAFIFLYYKMHQ